MPSQKHNYFPNASDVNYKNNKTVASALDDLYSKVPKGKITITEKGKEIDVSKYQYIDTTGLYTQAEYDAKATINKQLLWSNGNPNSAFVGQNISLSQGISTFSHILIQWKTDIKGNLIYEDLFKIAPVREGCENKAEYGLIAINADGSTNFARSCAFPDNDSDLRVTDAYAINASKSNNNKIIPIAIYGLNLSY